MVDVPDGADGIPAHERALMSTHDVGGDVMGKGEVPLGVPLIPDRAPSRSRPAGWSVGRPDALGARRPAIIGVAALAVLALAVASARGTIPFPGAAAVAVLVPAAVVDIEQRRLPDTWVAAALGILVVALAASLAFGESNDAAATIGAVLGASATMALPVLALHLVSPASMGFGDVKAAAVLGAAVGTIDWRLGAVALCVASLSGAAVGLVTRRRTIAFGPFLVFGAWFALLAHGWIIGAVLAGAVTGAVAP
jgi:leader peptidase (prepilin peptidase) / N-methyltransferase